MGLMVAMWMSETTSANDDTVRRGLVLVAGLLAAMAGAVIILVAQPGSWRLAWAYGVVFGVVASTELGVVAAALVRPTRRRIVAGATTAAVVVVLWALARTTDMLPDPDPWVVVNGAVGVVGDVCAVLQAIAAILLGGAAIRTRPARGLRRFAGAVALVPVVAVVVVASTVGIAGAVASSAASVAPEQRSGVRPMTVEYCRPDGVPLAMDLYRPPASASEPGSPVVVYLHGGGWLGTRSTSGVGAAIAGNAGALFTPLQRRLNAAGVAVAAIDYRLAPATPWPAQLVDVKCAVRFLRARAGALEIDPTRIGVWGSSFGGSLAALLGVTGPDAGFDIGQYPAQSSGVRAVVDMFGAGDLNALRDASPVTRAAVWLLLGGSETRRRAASPTTYITAGAPPFLILHGTRDTDMPPAQSDRLARRLQRVGVPVTLVRVDGAGHGFTASTHQHPTSGELTATITDFFVTTLHPAARRWTADRS
jgi:acetyl esterase/lipase